MRMKNEYNPYKHHDASTVLRRNPQYSAKDNAEAGDEWVMRQLNKMGVDSHSLFGTYYRNRNKLISIISQLRGSWYLPTPSLTEDLLKGESLRTFEPNWQFIQPLPATHIESGIDVRWDAVKTFKPISTRDWYMRFAILNEHSSNPKNVRDELRSGVVMLSDEIISTLDSSPVGRRFKRRLKRIIWLQTHDTTVHNAVNYVRQDESFQDWNDSLNAEPLVTYKGKEAIPNYELFACILHKLILEHLFYLNNKIEYFIKKDIELLLEDLSELQAELNLTHDEKFANDFYEYCIVVSKTFAFHIFAPESDIGQLISNSHAAAKKNNRLLSAIHTYDGIPLKNSSKPLVPVQEVIQQLEALVL